MSNAQRLDNVENDLETVKQLLVSTASYAESADKRIDRLVERQDLTQKQLDGLAVTVQVMGENIDIFMEKIDKFVEKTDKFVEKTDDFIDTTKARNAVLDGVILELRESQMSTNAAVERLDRILEQLLKRNQ
ncbi:hypothetical protein [Nostoc sp. CHAB 5715]|uniref:hypothetical protein n=1 Tax=Nostoc sp. CHAB 5715 TaxID=2780400 RepID=UPI001E537778|nr:hypothetical protein [Nostoc sp. CHAB 5715]MCC5626551.1 hypothetical protein [Nostoc sp. CHAB 5715]